MLKLPDYAPPNTQRALVAVALAPLIVLLAFTLIVTRLIDPDTGFAWFAACSIWVVYEMHDYQRIIDAYNAQYVTAHLSWRSSQALAALVAVEGTAAPTRDFVLRFIDAGRVLLRDGQRV
jgi:hypothetical protein